MLSFCFISSSTCSERSALPVWNFPDWPSGAGRRGAAVIDCEVSILQRLLRSPLSIQVLRFISTSSFHLSLSLCCCRVGFPARAIVEENRVLTSYGWSPRTLSVASRDPKQQVWCIEGGR